MSRAVVKAYAHAKINLSLEILGKRPDGYHEIVSLMQALALHDSLTFTAAELLTLRSSAAELEMGENLILRAAKLLQAECGISAGVVVELEKRIPVAAGLGGGSSDCAATLLALNEIWGLGLSRERLVSLSLKLGSDIPYFFYGGTALVEGRGETVTPLPAFPFHWVVLVTPRVDLPEKTKTLYGKITPDAYTSGDTTRRLAERVRRGEPVDVSEFSNAFLPILLNESPAVRMCWERLHQAGAEHVLLSGSGPTLYVLLEDESDGRALCALLMGLDAQVQLTTTTSLEQLQSTHFEVTR